ncbi:MAG: hypothetical protein FWF49_02960, partial [Oscillospiraceae bacterium]|nr:hypothetical protein [Oscillospiraceae bacterium]
DLTIRGYNFRTGFRFGPVCPTQQSAVEAFVQKTVADAMGAEALLEDTLVQLYGDSPVWFDGGCYHAYCL